MTNSWIALTMLGALAASGASPDVEPYLTLAGREIRAEGVKLVRIGDRRRVSFTARQAGEYTVRLLQAGEGKLGGRLAKTIFVVPASAGPPPAEPW